MADEDLITVTLTDQERYLLDRGLREWLGPARCSDELAVAMGFAGFADLVERNDALVAAVHRGCMRAADWCRVLLATEIVFASDIVGAGHDWPFTTGLSDEESITVLRAIQHKMPSAVFAVVRGADGTAHPPS